MFSVVLFTQNQIECTHHCVTTPLLFLVDRDQCRLEDFVEEGDLTMINHCGPNIYLDAIGFLLKILDECLNVI